MKTLRIAACLPFAFFLATTTALADTQTDVTAHEIFGEVMSPFCPGRLLNDCPSGSASELKAKIRTDLEQGVPREKIYDDLVARYGEGIRAEPAASGFGLWAWVTPFLFLAGGFMTWSLFVRRRREEDAPNISPIDPEMARRIERELNAES